MSRPGQSSTDRTRREECARLRTVGIEINNLPDVLWSMGPFPRLKKSDDCGICKVSRFSCNSVLKHELSHYFHVGFQKRQVDFRANNEHLVLHERLPSGPVCKQVTNVVNVWKTRWKEDNGRIERTEEVSANRRWAEKKRMRNQKRHGSRRRMTQFHKGSDSRGSQRGTTNIRREQTGVETMNNSVRTVRDRTSDLFQDIRNRQALHDTRHADIERRRRREIGIGTLKRTTVSAGSRRAPSNSSELNTESTSSRSTIRLRNVPLSALRSRNEGNFQEGDR